jgi:ankyrin repeat protein
LSNGADPNLVSPASDPPLIIAIKLGDVELVERLLEAGADTGAEGATAPLLVATWVVSGTEASTLAIVRRLLRAGARTDVTGVGGQNLLSVAAYNNPFLVPLYLRLGLDVNHRSTRRYTPLMYAAHMGPAALDSARLLVEKGADIEAVSMDGWTPLMFAADSLNVPMVNWLLEQGAETMVVNKAGETALDIALKRHSPYQLRADTVDLLRRATAAAGSAALAAP